jgi:hypothetical protein
MGSDRPAPCITAEEIEAAELALSPYKHDAWLKLSPRERLRRSWALRSSLNDVRAIHDRKLLPVS